MLEWAFGKVDLDISVYPRMFTWLVNQCNRKVLDFMNVKLNNSLLTKEIDFMMLEERKESIIGDLIITK